jgi:hypothetical protein
MLTQYSVNGFGAVPTLPQLLQRARQREMARRGFAGFGAAGSDWPAFVAGGASATYQDAAKVVWCNKDHDNRIQCQLQKYTGSAARSGPVADMQRAADAIMNQIPAYNLGGQQMHAPVPSGDGTTTTEQTFTILDNGQNPIGSQSGYDGINGPLTQGIVGQALILAGMLQQVPDNVALAFVSPSRLDIYTMYATEISQYLNGVAGNFVALLQAFQNRGNVPASTPLDVATIPAVVPAVIKSNQRKIVAIVGASATVLGLTTVAAVASAKHKPHALYDDIKPALGRSRRRYAWKY